MTDSAGDGSQPRVGGALLAGGLAVVAYSVVVATLKLYLERQAVGPGSADPTVKDFVRLALAWRFVQNLLSGPVTWIVGSMLLACGLAIFDQQRPFRRVLAATGIPFAAPAVVLAALYATLVAHPRPGDVVSIEILIAWVAGIGFLAALVWIVVRLRELEVEIDRGGSATAFAAVLFAFGKWLPALIVWARS